MGLSRLSTARAARGSPSSAGRITLERCQWRGGATRCAPPPRWYSRSSRRRERSEGRSDRGISAYPGASNVIPKETTHSLDLRHPDDGARERLRDLLERRAAEIAASCGCEHRWQVRQETLAVPADLRLTALLEAAVEASGLPVRRLASGAGHDAAQMAALAPRGHALRAVRGGHKPQPCGVGYCR